MRIQNPPQAPTVDRASVRQVPATTAVPHGEPAVGGASAEKVTLSAAAKGLADRLEANEVKMSRLRESLKDGSFAVDAGKIASKLLGEGE